MKKLLLFCATMMLLLSCGGSEEVSGAKQLDFDVETATENPSELLTTKYIKLETNDNCLVGQINQIKSTKEYIFILDRITEKIWVFTHSGKFIGDVGREGKGPEEYVSPSSFFINEEKGYISIVDHGSGKILNYSSTNNFEFVSSTPLDKEYGYVFEVTEKGNIICENGYRDDGSEMSKKQYLVLDKEFKVTNSFLDKGYEKLSVSISSAVPMYKYDEDVYGYGKFAPIVYKLSEEKAIPFYSLKFGENTLVPVSFYETVGDVYKWIDTINESGHIGMYSVFETSKGLCVSYSMGFSTGEDYIGFWDKKIDKTYCYDKKDFVEKMGVGAMRAHGVILGSFVASLDIASVLEAQQEGAVLNETLSKLINDSKEGDNPILCLFNFK